VLSNLAVGAHTIAVTYASNTNFAATDNTGAPLSQSVTQVATATSLSASPNPATPGQTIAFTATVVTQGAGGGTPTGQVMFTITGPVNTTVSAALNSAGKAIYTTSALPAGIYSVSASYQGSLNFAASASKPYSQKIATNTTTKVSSSKNPATFGQSVTLNATVAGAGATGTITFYVDGVAQAPISINGSGKASLTLSKLGVGSHTIKAVYSGDPNFNGSTGSFTQTMYHTTGRRL